MHTLFDLYSNVKQYPIGSEIIFAPPISIPGMIDIVTYYNLVIRGVHIILPTQTQTQSSSSTSSTSSLDINLTINIQAIFESITERTVAIMIVHPFGMICTSKVFEIPTKYLTIVINK